MYLLTRFTFIIRALRMVSCSLLLALSGYCLADDPVVLKQATFFQATTMDPIYATTLGDYQLQYSLHEGLTTLSSDGLVEPGLAKSWDISPDGKQYTFHLRDNITWSDGTPIIAKDFLTTLVRMHDPANDKFSKPFFLSLFIENSREIQAGKKSVDTLGVSIPDDKTVVFHLIQPLTFFPTILGTPAFSPSPTYLIEKYGNNWTAREHIVSSGAFIVSPQPDPEAVYTLDKNKNYYAQQQVEIDQVQIFQPDNSINKTLYDIVASKFDMIQPYLSDQLRDIEMLPDPPVAIFRIRSNATNYIALNQENPKLQDKRIREALSMVTDREQIAQEVGNKKTAATYSFAIPSSTSGWTGVPTSWANQSMQERIEGAQSLMQAAGFGPLKRLKLEFKVNDNSAAERMSVLLKEQWAKIWVDIRLISQPAKDLYVDLANGHYEVARAGWFADYDDPLTFMNILHPDSIKNYTRWKNSDFKTLLDDINNTNLTQEQRFEHFRKMELLIQQDVPIIPVYNNQDYTILSKRFRIASTKPNPEINYMLARHIHPVKKP